MKNLNDYTSLPKLGDALVQMDKDFDNKLITLDQLMQFNKDVTNYFISKI